MDKNFMIAYVNRIVVLHMFGEPFDIDAIRDEIKRMKLSRCVTEDNLLEARQTFFLRMQHTSIRLHELPERKGVPTMRVESIYRDTEFDGNIFVKGNISGEIKVKSAGSIKVGGAICGGAKVISGSDVVATDVLSGARVFSNRNITIKRSFSESVVIATLDITIHNAGDEHGHKAVIQAGMPPSIFEALARIEEERKQLRSQIPHEGPRKPILYKKGDG